MLTDRIAAYVLFATTLTGIGSTAWQFAGKVKAERERDSVRMEYAHYKQAAAEAYAQALKDEQRKHEARVNKQQAAMKEANHALQSLASERDRALHAARSLYEHAQGLAAAAKRCDWTNSASATDAPGPADLLADMHRRTDEAAGAIALYADSLRIEAQRCRASENALTE